MCIEQISHSTVKLSLNSEDLQRLQISFESISCTDPNTRRALLELLATAQEETGFDPAGARLLVEVYRSQDGLTFLFSLLGPSQTGELELDACPTTPVVFSFGNLDSMVLGASSLFEQYGHRVFKSALYRVCDTYQLAIYPLDAAENTAVRYLSEFGKLVGKGEIYTAFLREHGKELIADNAIDRITYYLA